MGGPEQGLPTEVVFYVVVIAAVLLYFKMSNLRHDIERRIRDLHDEVGAAKRDIEQRIGDLHHEVGAAKREIEYRANAHDRDLERLLSERRTSR